MTAIKNLLIPALLLVTIPVVAQQQLLKEYNFDEGGYYLLGIRSYTDPHPLADSLGEFYVDDIKVLNTIKKEWVFKKPSPMYACGYHYNIVICKDGAGLESFAINLNCNTIVSDEGHFFFSTKKLEMFKSKIKRPYAKVERFSSIDSARMYRAKVTDLKGLIFTPTPDWTRFEGKFGFTYHCNASKDCLGNEKELLKLIEAEINKTYPGEDFALDGRGGSRTDLFVEIRSNKSLADQFTLYDKSSFLGKWDSYELELLTYWARASE